MINFESIKAKLLNSKAIVIFGVVGIALIFFSGYINNDKSEETSKITDSNAFLQEYIAGVKSEVKEMVMGITGEKEPYVMVTAESDVRHIYAQESKRSEKDGSDSSQYDSEESYVIVKNSGGTQEPVTVTQIQPEIKGVVIVSEYARDSVKKEQIIEAVRTSLDLSSSKVYVAQKYKQKQQ